MPSYKYLIYIDGRKIAETYIKSDLDFYEIYAERINAEYNVVKIDVV